ncbi:MAG: nucleoside triphosphate pyrophosphohydrolase [Candidatus Komeilibacteria bacterium]|jgi:predicted house-cleaning noncanonical NTP pyrophosphatase (MazG superfamily)|nr:nucleoside triphosphate pyrophosphohydrolase [Candidatus Komeilibacteria bacterium]MBT4447668.1 nucleoside triphosphate pyrophosphohydrolase [Candidatus Komeilibacteria bacterium]
MSKKYNKLIRDKIPEIIITNNGQPVTHIASDDEYKIKLKAKLLEEANEFIESEDITEIADIYEVIDAICKLYGFNKEEIAKIKQDKFNKRGGFDKKIILDES